MRPLPDKLSTTSRNELEVFGSASTGLPIPWSGVGFDFSGTRSRATAVCCNVTGRVACKRKLAHWPMFSSLSAQEKEALVFGRG